MKVLRLGRVRLPVVAYMLFLFGVLLAVSSGARFSFERFAWGSAMIIAAALSVNYGNDYFDMEVDRLNEASPISGGSRVLLKNPELANLSKWIAICLMGISMALAVILALVFSFPISFIVLVVSGNGLIWFYSAPPLRLSYRGFGEITTMLAVGLMLPCSGYFIMLGSVDSIFWTFSLPFILYALSIIVSVEVPDMEGDIQGHKNTLVVRIGRRFSFVLILVSNLLATLYLYVLSRSNLAQAAMDLSVITIFSLPPLVTGILGFVEGRKDRRSATRLATFNVYAISSMLLITDCYLILTLI